jgi:hypothetical protein
MLRCESPAGRISPVKDTTSVNKELNKAQTRTADACLIKNPPSPVKRGINMSKNGNITSKYISSSYYFFRNN